MCVSVCVEGGGPTLVAKEEPVAHRLQSRALRTRIPYARRWSVRVWHTMAASAVCAIHKTEGGNKTGFRTTQQGAAHPEHVEGQGHGNAKAKQRAGARSRRSLSERYVT